MSSPAPQGGPPRSSNRAFALAVLLLLSIAAFQLLPELGLVDFHREEGRRVLPARAMLETGDWIVPRLWTQPYLSKPPGIYWALAAIFELAGGISELTARALAVVSTVASALGILWLGRVRYGLRSGVYAGALFLLAMETQAKGRLAEIEAPLTTAVLVAVAAYWFAREGRAWVWTLAGLGLAAALLLKGPVALLYYLPAPILLAIVKRKPTEILRPGFLWSLLLGIGLPGLWAWKLFEVLGSEAVLEQWTSQVTGQGGRSITEFMKERAGFIGGSLFAFAPAVWIVVAAIGTPLARRWLREERFAIPAFTVGIGWLFFLFFPGTSVRYLIPAFPFVALLAGEALANASAVPRAEKCLARFAGLARALAVLAVLLAAALGVAFFVPIDDVRSNGLGLFLALLLAVLGVFVWRLPASDERRLPAAFFLIPLLFGQVIATQVEYTKAARHARVELARALDAELPPGAILHLVPWSTFNTLVYLEHDVRPSPDVSLLHSGDYVLVEADRFDALGLQPGDSRLVLALVIRDRDWVLFELRPQAGP